MLEAMPAPPREPPWREFARAPLVPPALGAAAGLAADRFLGVPVEASLGLAVLGLLAAAFAKRASAIFLAAGVAGLAAAHHHLYRDVYPADDIGHLAGDAPAILKLRGFLDEEPVLRPADRSELFGPARRVDRATTVLSVSEIALTESWHPVSGRVRLVVERDIPREGESALQSLSVGDEIEAVGLLTRPRPPGNPGERDYAADLLEHRIRAELRITKGAEGVSRLSEGDGSWPRMLARMRGRFTKVLRETLPPRETPLARALLLGDTSATDQDDWDAFARTGVLHVLAISGQHLVILAGAVWWILRIFGFSRRRGAWFVVALIVLYAALTGGRPSAVRAAVMVGIVCGGIFTRRSVNAANALALAWLIVVALGPTEAMAYGSILSFLSVFVLIFGAARWVAPRPRTPAEQLMHDARPAWEKVLRALGRGLFMLYSVNALLAITNTPLIIANKNVAPPIGLFIGPPLVVLTTVALLSGFLQMTVGILSPLLAAPFAAVTAESLSISQAIVRFGDNLPGGTVYVPDLPLWWLFVFHGLLIVLVLFNATWKRFLLVLAVWTVVGLAAQPGRSTDELRMTFLSVGHGGCTVIETPDGRVLLYDAGTMGGPDAVRHVIAPFLWHRGIRRVDELFLSHADLDHYNGVPELLRRFPVGQVTMTPSFAEKAAPEVAEVLLELDRHHVPRRIAVAGEVFLAGDVTLTVLHPPLVGPGSSENERSLVLKVTHAGHTILLTGDLEKTGTAMLLAQPPQSADVMMAPHHGSPAAFPAALAAWARPKLVVVSRGPRSGQLNAIDDAWDTWTNGAVTLRSHAAGLTAETFRTHQRKVVQR